jgi:bifunctional enzyme CysN/CysC
MNHQGLEPGRTYLLKHTAQTVRATVNRIKYRVNVNTLEHEPTATLALNEIGAVALETHRPLFFDSYADNRITGAFILIDPVTNETLAGGMISGRGDVPEATREELEFRTDRVTQAERFARYGHHPALVDVPNEDAAYEIERELFERGGLVQVLIGEAIRQEVLDVVTAAGGIALCVKPGVDAVTVKDLEKRGVIRPLEDPFTGGAGI